MIQESYEQMRTMMTGLSPEVSIGTAVLGLTMSTMTGLKGYIAKRLRPLAIILMSSLYGTAIGFLAYNDWKLGTLSGLIAGASSMGVYDTYNHAIKKKSGHTSN